MQFQKLNLDGTPVGAPTVLASSNDYAADAIAASLEDNGYHVIMGFSLDSEERGEKQAAIVASQGVIIFNNYPE